jgi:hypothetical protein
MEIIAKPDGKLPGLSYTALVNLKYWPWHIINSCVVTPNSVTSLAARIDPRIEQSYENYEYKLN